jgi:hypothetical protein
MAFKNAQPSVSQRERFDIYNENDKKEVLCFEEELKPYLQRSFTLFGKVLTGFELYLHENGMLRYSVRYPDGAVVFENLEKYRIADMKYHALTELWDRRQKAEQKERERIQTLNFESAKA